MNRRAKPIQAAIGLVERGGRYLICQRRADDFLGGLWEFPGGKREPGEPWEACLRRELREELGIAVQAIRRFGTMRYRYGERPITFMVFRCAVAHGRPKPLDAQMLRWVLPGQLRQFRFPPANQRLLARLGSAPISRAYRDAACYNNKRNHKRRK